MSVDGEGMDRIRYHPISATLQLAQYEPGAQRGTRGSLWKAAQPLTWTRLQAVPTGIPNTREPRRKPCQSGSVRGTERKGVGGGCCLLKALSLTNPSQLLMATAAPGMPVTPPV